MKTIEQLGERTLEQKLKAIYTSPELTPEQIALRDRIEARLWQLYVEKHPPVHTPANFIEKDEDW
jgi:hypothetical protein